MIKSETSALISLYLIKETSGISREDLAPNFLNYALRNIHILCKYEHSFICFDFIKIEECKKYQETLLKVKTNMVGSQNLQHCESPYLHCLRYLGWIRISRLVDQQTCIKPFLISNVLKREQHDVQRSSQTMVTSLAFISLLVMEVRAIYMQLMMKDPWLH